MAKFIRTRHISTEEAYLNRALWFETYASKFLKQENVTPLDIANVAVMRKPTWSTSTWRQIKASLIFKFGLSRNENAMQAVKMLQNETQAGTIKRSLKTSGQRTKNVDSVQFENIIANLSQSRSTYAIPLKNWLLMGSIFGLRPHEWTQANVVWISDFEIFGSGDNLSTKPYLKIKNSKNSNSRSHGEFRHLSLNSLNDAELYQVIEFTIFMASIFSSGEYKSFYESCRKLLLRINIKNNLQSKKHIQIYSPRHKFASVAKNTFSKQEVAAMMGHGNDLTADGHYGRKNSANGTTMLTPIQAEVNKVKVKNKGVPQHILIAKPSKLDIIDKAKYIMASS